MEMPLEAIPGLQQYTEGNGVAYVHQNPPRRPAPAPQRDAAAAAPGSPGRRWPVAEAPPRGYAYEFGTGRLIRLYT